MLINKLICRLAFPLRGCNIVNPVYLFAAQKASKAEGSDASKPKQAKKAEKAPSTPQEKARQAQQNAEKKKQQQQDLKNSIYSIKSNAGNMYRKIIRGIEVDKKTERATFNEQSLMQIINIATREDLRLMYEAYYNFMGHYTSISNQTVDAMINKTISLALKNKTIPDQYADRVFEMLQNHEYLGYFPHYTTTLKAAQFAVKVDKFPRFLQLLKNKPLIKLDGDTVRGLLDLATNWVDFVKLSKNLAYRANRQILADITNDELLELISSRIKKSQKITLTNLSKQFKQFLQKFDPSNRNLASAWLLINLPEQVCKTLNTVPKDDPFIKEFAEIVGKVEEGKLARVKEQLQSGLENSQHKGVFI